MFGLSRNSRLMVILLLVIVIPSLYLLYPSSSDPPSDDGHMEQGGIDSPHWRAPISPVLEQDTNVAAGESNGERIENEELRWEVEDQDSAGDGMEVVDESADTKSGSDGLSSGKEQTEVVLNAGTSSATGNGVIMPKMENATAKAELGRSAWKVLHLMTLRYPDKPSQDDRDALKSYFHLFSRLYPCGECAAEFQMLLKKYPPQTSSRKSASMWLCFIHNLINERLGKPEFDCLTLDETYDCGCGPEGALGNATASATAAATDAYGA